MRKTINTLTGPITYETTPAREGAARFVQFMILALLALIILTGVGCVLA